VYAKAEDGFHVYITCCSTTRDIPFEIDFTGVFFYFTVSTASWPAQHALPIVHEDLPGLAKNFIVTRSLFPDVCKFQAGSVNFGRLTIS
jgi:hypothetical protein